MAKHFFARWMHQRERYWAERNDNRQERLFEWGQELADKRFFSDSNGVSPQSFFRHYAKNALQNSDDFFASGEVSDYKLNNAKLTWTSQIVTEAAENNVVHARYFPTRSESAKHKKKRAVVVLPHWNAEPESYIALCKMLNRFGMSAVRLTLPYHEERNLPEHERADFLVCPNIGRTLQSVRQAVVDTKAAVAWLRKQGYERVGIVGTSIGSCTAFLTMAHDLEIDAGVFNHVSSYFADVVWRGISTYHVQAALGKQVTLDELREYWMPISPQAYLEKLKKLPPRPLRFIYTLYDLTFPVDLSRETIATLQKYNIKHDTVVLPCGHYTLGRPPWVYFDGYSIVSFLRKHL
jgi:hypothetical protein